MLTDRFWVTVCVCPEKLRSQCVLHLDLGQGPFCLHAMFGSFREVYSISVLPSIFIQMQISARGDENIFSVKGFGKNK